MAYIPWKSRKPDYSKLLKPEDLRTALLRTALFIVAYETLKERVTMRPRELFANSFDEHGMKVDEDEYQRSVGCRHSSRTRASLLWFEEMGAIDAVDIELFFELTRRRNEIVHELHTLAGTSDLDGGIL